MQKELEELCAALDALSALVLRSWTDDRTLTEVHGWNHPALTRQDLAHMPAALAKKIRDAAPTNVEPQLLKTLTEAAKRLQHLHGNTIAHMFNGHGSQAVPAFMSTLDALEATLQPILGWQTLHDNKALPAALVRRLRSIQAELDSAAPDKEGLLNQIALIQQAVEAAESLPADLQSLTEARRKVDKISNETSEMFGKISERAGEASTAVERLSAKEKEADKLVQQCEEAYRITTTKGLAAAFDQRASRLGWSMWVWVAGLLLALVIGSSLGSSRVAVLTSSISVPNPQWGVIWMQIVLSVLSVGAPLWFAWLATKQIGQRFRLAEDYGFKASVAKAYEGYRREAARIDQAFEARLFSSSLSRLEEHPLRLVENVAHGSPWHELVSSNAFQTAIKTVPELREKFTDLAKTGIDGFKSPKIGNTHPTQAAPTN